MLVIKTKDCRLSEVVKNIYGQYDAVQFFATGNIYYDMHFNTPQWAGVNLSFSAARHIIDLPEKYCTIITDATGLGPSLNAGNITIIGNQPNLEKKFKLSANGANGKNGAAGRNGLDGVDGVAGVNGKDYFFSALVHGSNWYKHQSWLGRSMLLAKKYPRQITTQQVAQWNTNIYSVCCGVLGSDGKPGSKGGNPGNGEPGGIGGKGGKITVGAKVHYGLDGKNGLDGKPGQPGRDGRTGPSGTDYAEVYLAKPVYLPQNSPIVLTGRIKDRRYKYFFMGQPGYSLPLPELQQTSLIIHKPLLFSVQSSIDYMLNSVCNNILGEYEQKLTEAFTSLFVHYRFAKHSYMQCIYEINRRFAMALQFKCAECESTIGLVSAIESLVRLFLCNYNFNIVDKIVSLQQMLALKSFLKTSLDNIITDILSNETANIANDLNLDLKISRKINKEVQHIHVQVKSYLVQYFGQMLVPTVLRLKLR